MQCTVRTQPLFEHKVGLVSFGKGAGFVSM
jgi:hypothetical protein